MMESGMLTKAIAEEYKFDQQLVSIGSHPDNEIVLMDEGVLPFHATVVLEGEQLILVSMQPNGEILVDDSLLQESKVNLKEAQMVVIGKTALFFQHNGDSGGVRVLLSPFNQAMPEQYFTEGGESTILLNVLSGEAEVDVDQTAIFEFEVVNAGPIVASFFVHVKGVPEAWVDISPASVNLNEGQRHRVQVQITPPRDPSSSAGLHPLQVIVASPNYGGQRGIADLLLTIHPYSDYAVGNLSPKDQRIHWRKRSGMTFLPVTNLSNGPAEFNLMAMDDENGCTFDFCMEEEVQFTRQATTRLQAGEMTEVPIQITPARNPMFALRNKRYHFTTNVQIAQNATIPQVVSGSVTSVPLFGWWSIMLGIASILLAMFFVLQPNIRSFEVAAGKDVIELGDTTKLLWEVSPFATRLSISNIDQPISRGQFSRTVAPEQSTTYELVSGNWLSGLFGLDQKRSLTVLVVPPTPAVNVFEVDKTTVAKGQPVTVRWSILEADEAFLTIDEVIYPLAKEKFSGEQEVVLDNDALITLEARNASGSELQSYFVNVIPPFIDIATFTVWVRPDSVAYAPSDMSMARTSSGSKLMSRIQSPDPNFPVKFVELVPDANSDMGYRVVFNPNVRQELQKGEQVILEWRVEGVDSLKIAPFAEELPARGSQPAFPQESLNFVMTAQSGELLGIYMLPVKVFDGKPPEAPKIEFFTASPSSMVGAGVSEFAWSVSGEWSRVQISSGEEIVADYVNPQGFKKINVESTKSFLLTAWNGNLSSSKIIEVVVNPALKPVNLEITDIQDHSGFYQVGDKVNVFIELTDPKRPDPNHPGKFLPPSPYPTGTVTITDGFATCIINLPLRYCPDGFTFNAPGDANNQGRKEIVASYSGDSIYLVADSAAYNKHDIVVTANTVSLKPSFFDYFDTNNGVTIGGEIKPLTSANLVVGEGLYIDVAVSGETAQLIDDDKSTIVVRYCPINPVTDEIQLNSCGRTLPATVSVASLGGFNIGRALIAIPHLNSVGKYAVLIQYSHLDGAFESTLLQDEDNQFDVAKGQVVLLPDGLEGCTIDQCKIISRTDEPLYFTGRLIVNNAQTPLYATYPEPGDREATTFSVIYTPASSGVPVDWSEQCSWASTDRWRLECKSVTINQDGIIQYEMEDANYRSLRSVSIQVKLATNIVVDGQFASAVSVGKTIDLQKDHVVVREKLTQGVLDGVPVYLELVSGEDIGNLIEIVGAGNTCALEGGRLKMTQGIPLTANQCNVYFRHAGFFNTRFVYEGNTVYDKSNALYTFDVQQQKIKVTWKNQGGNNLTTTRQIFDEIPLELTFECDGTTNCENFSRNSLRNTSVQISLSGVQGCKAYQGTNELTDGKFTLPGILTGGEMVLTDFKLRCTNLGTLTASLQFIDPSNADFNIAVGSGRSQNFTITKRQVTITPTIGIYTGANTTNTITIGTTTDPVGNNSPALNNDDRDLWLGEKYLIKASFPMPADAQPVTSDVIVMKWPSGTDAKVELVDCQDLDTTSGDDIHKLPLRKNETTGNWEAICIFKPTGTNTFSGNPSFDFGLDPLYTNSRIAASDQKINSNANIAKRSFAIAESFSGGVVDPGVATNYYALNGPNLQLVFSDQHYQMDAITNWQNYLTVTMSNPSETLTCTKTNDTTVSCPIPDKAITGGSGGYTVTYTDHPSFENVSNPFATLNIIAIPVKLVDVTGDFPTLITCKWLNCSSTWPYTAGNHAAFTYRDYLLTFTVDTEPEVSQKVPGFVTVSFGEWTACNVTILDNTATKFGACSYKVPIQSNETATFKWRFTGVASNRSYTLGYDNDNGTHPFTKGTLGWGSSTTFTIWTWLELKVEPATCGSEKGYRITKPDGSGLPMQTNGYQVYTEYPHYGGGVFENQQYFECEIDNVPCWGGDLIYKTNGGGEDDGCIQTEPNWDKVIENNVFYQLIIKNNTNNLLGWLQFLP
jgi:hypothetical protein